jgi:hypothetical protein
MPKATVSTAIVVNEAADAGTAGRNDNRPAPHRAAPPVGFCASAYFVSKRISSALKPLLSAKWWATPGGI